MALILRAFFLGMVFLCQLVWSHLNVTQSASIGRGELGGTGTAMHHFSLKNAAAGLQLVKTWCFTQILKTATHSLLRNAFRGLHLVKI